jgi:hypothetical protein
MPIAIAATSITAATTITATVQSARPDDTLSTPTGRGGTVELKQVDTPTNPVNKKFEHKQ